MNIHWSFEIQKWQIAAVIYFIIAAIALMAAVEDIHNLSVNPYTYVNAGAGVWCGVLMVREIWKGTKPTVPPTPADENKNATKGG